MAVGVGITARRFGEPRSVDEAPGGAGGPRATAAGGAFEALADEHRRTILRLLSSGDRPVREIADELPISRPAVSRHLRLLKEAGLVAERPDGTRRIYRLEDRGVAAIHDYLGAVWGDAAARFRLYAENTRGEEES